MESKKFKTKMHKVMSEFKQGDLHSGSKRGPEVHSRKQAIAIGMSEARKSSHEKAIRKALIKHGSSILK